MPCGESAKVRVPSMERTRDQVNHVISWCCMNSALPGGSGIATVRDMCFNCYGRSSKIV
jgi:hypothetical protein